MERELLPLSITMAVGQVTEPSEQDSDLERLRTILASQRAEIERLNRGWISIDRFSSATPCRAIVYETASLRILDANDSALALYGYPHEQMCSMGLLDLFAPDERRQSAELMLELRRPINTIGPFVQRSARGQDLVVSMISFAYNYEGVDTRIVMIQDETAAPVGGRSTEGQRGALP